MYGMNEIQIVELILLLFVSGLVVGTFLGALVRGLRWFIYS